MKKIEVMAKTVESAIEKGLAELGITREQADIQILSEGGFFKQSKVIVSQKKTVADAAVEFVEKLLEKMSVTCIVEADETEEEIKLNLIGTDTSSLIGYRGEVLDSLQFLASVAANKSNEEYKRIVIDTEDYRSKRIGSLEQLAKNLEQKVIRTKRPTRLEPMNSFERRIIHSTLQDSEEVKTSSEGESPFRFVVIYPKKTEHSNFKASSRPRSTADEGRNEKSETANASEKKRHNFVYRSDKKKRR